MEHRVLVIAVLTLAQARSAATREETAKPLSGNKPCAYPAAAEARRVSGPVHFVAQVRPEGTTESVEITALPAPDMGFDEVVRACVADWRFDPAEPGASGLRTYRGTVRYRIAKEEEMAIRQLLESLAAAWNASDKTAAPSKAIWKPGEKSAAPWNADKSAIAALEAAPGERRDLPDELKPHNLPLPRRNFLRNQLAAVAKNCQVMLQPEVNLVQFIRSDVVDIAQTFTCVPLEAADGADPSASVGTLHLAAVKGSRGWRFAQISSADVPSMGLPRVGRDVSEPKQLRHVKPVYDKLDLRGGVLEGNVVVDCVISPEGNVTQTRILWGVPPVDQAVINAVSQWQYAPTVLNGHAVSVAMSVTVSFRLP